MCRWLLIRTTVAILLAAFAAAPAHARRLAAHVDRITTAAATLEGVELALDWPADADEGVLDLSVSTLEAPDLGYRFRSLRWRCPLRRNGASGWRCEGDVRAGGGAAMRLAIALDDRKLEAGLQQGRSGVRLQRDAKTPDDLRIYLARVPLAWSQALLAKAWSEAHITRGTLDGVLTLDAQRPGALRVDGRLSLREGAFDTPDGTVAAENLAGDFDLRFVAANESRATLEGRLDSGDMLFGNAFVSLQDRDVALQVDAEQAGPRWRLPHFRWHDPGRLIAEGQAELTADATLQSMDVRVQALDLAPLRDAYLSGFLGLAGLSQVGLSGSADARIQMEGVVLRLADARLRQVTIDDPGRRFGFERLDGDLRYTAGEPLDSALAWQGGTLYGLDFGPARLPLRSERGEIVLREAVTVPVLGGRLQFDDLRLRPPQDGEKLDVRFGMTLEQLDVARLAAALEWPAFTGELSGAIPDAHYRNERLDFGGGLRLRVFDGEVSVSALAMERPFGVAPTLSADIAFDDLDLEGLTGVFGFGSITGRLDGRIGGLRMVDWQPVAFDAELRTDRSAARRHREPQRISQRAVQDLSSVGDPTFATTLQSRLIGLFDDFRYSRIGISCALSDEVCRMDGLGSAGRGFIIVEGAGLPRLTVVGFNRRVDWPTLLERLEAVGQGDVSPVVE